MSEELTDDFFNDLGFDMSSEPFTKDCVDGKITVYKNYIRDGSGNYDGYLIVRPASRAVKYVDDFFNLDKG